MLASIFSSAQPKITLTHIPPDDDDDDDPQN